MEIHPFIIHINLGWFLKLKADTMVTILNFLLDVDIFSLEDVEFEVKRLNNVKGKDIDIYQVEIFEMRWSILIPYIHNILN